MATSTFEPATVTYTDSDMVVGPDVPAYALTEEYYEEGCESLWDKDNKRFPNGEVCGGKVVSTGGHHHYSNGYDCYTMYLHCERCGDYEVECV